MARQRAKAPPNSPGLKTVLRWALRLLPAGILLVAGVVTFLKVETYLIESPRFCLGSAGKYGDSAPDIRIHGRRYASEQRVREVFAKDIGQSVYLCPVTERRLRLLGVDWVKNASVSRIWPNRIVVTLRERTPVAFVELSGRQGRTRVALIDADGVILEQPPKSDYSLPVLTGLSEAQPEKARAARVRRMMAMLGDAGPLSRQISEIDVSDPDSLRISESVAGNPVVLILGREGFRRRIENFLAHYAEIHRRLPAATTFDLRIADRITAVDGVRRGS